MRELFDLLGRGGVPMLIIGGHGLSVHGVQRDTIDLDCLIHAERRSELTAHLTRHGFQEMARHQSFSRFRHDSLIFPILDVMEVDAGTWAKMESASVLGELFGHQVRVPAVLHYIALKLHAIRQNPDREDKDRQDIVELLRANREAVPVADLRAMVDRYAPAGFWDTLRPKI
jgi:hypothetical protein